MLLSIARRFLGRRIVADVEKAIEATKDPQGYQQRLLLSMIERESQTGFGRDHGFASIRSVEDFRRQVPIAGYDYYAPYIERVKNGETDAMFHDQKVLMFALTSGTTSSRKFIPVTERFLDDYRRGWALWGFGVFYPYPELFARKKIVMVSDWQEFNADSGIPCGSISGLSAQIQTPVFRWTYLLPAETSMVHDVEAKFYLAWRLGLVRDVGMLISPNPSTHVGFARFGDRHKESLIRDLYEGGISETFGIPEAVLQARRRWLRPNPKRARQVEQAIAKSDRLRPNEVWPNLKMIGCWLGGSAGIYLRHFPEYFGDVITRDIGLIASECRMTIPVEDNTAAGVLEISSNYYEFVPVEEIDSPQPNVLGAHEIEEGCDYYILLTTSSGLYRYHIHDVVRCVGHYEQTPLISFLNKGSRFSNMTGEKLSEHQVAEAVEGALSRLDLRLSTYTLTPCCDGEVPSYSLLIEESDLPDQTSRQALAREVERGLNLGNIEYQTKRESLRLEPVRIELLPSGAWERWDAQQLKQNGGTAEQYKHPVLVPDTGFRATLPLRKDTEGSLQSR